MPALAFVGWHEGRLAVRGPDGDALLHPLLVAGPDERYDVRLVPHPDGGAWLLAPLGPRDAAVRVPPGLDELKPAALPARAGTPGARDRFADRSGALLVLDDSILRVLAPNGEWAEYVLPADLRARAAALAPDGAPAVVGSVPAKRRRAQDWDAALYRFAAGEGRFVRVDVRLGLAAAARAAAADCVGAFDGLEASAEPAIVWSGAGDPALARSCVFAVDGRRRWTFARCERTIRDVLRDGDGEPLVVTAEGDLLGLRGGRLAARTTAAALSDAARATGGPPPDGARLLVRGADAAGADIAVVAGLCSATPDGPLTWHATVLLRSPDAGVSWEPATITRPVAGEPELLDVALLGGR